MSRQHVAVAIDAMTGLICGSGLQSVLLARCGVIQIRTNEGAHARHQ